MANEFGTHVVRFADVAARNEWVTTNYEMPHVSLTDAQTGIVEQVYYNERMTIPVNMHAGVLAWILSCVADKMNDENYGYWYEVYFYLLTSAKLNNNGTFSFARRDMLPQCIWMDPSNNQDNPISITLHATGGSSSASTFNGLDLSDPYATETSYFMLGYVSMPYEFYDRESHESSYTYISNTVNTNAWAAIEVSLSGGQSSGSTMTLQDNMNQSLTSPMVVVTTMDLIEAQEDDPQDIDKYEVDWLNLVEPEDYDTRWDEFKVYSYYCMCPAVYHDYTRPQD